MSRYVLPDPGTGGAERIALNLDQISLMILTVGGGTHSIEFRSDPGGTGFILDYADDASAQAAWDKLMGFASPVEQTPQPAMTITSISPTGGTTAGGNIVVITGTNFPPLSQVLVGGNAALGVVESSTTIRITTPAHAAGAVDVVVNALDGSSRTVTDAASYTYA